MGARCDLSRLEKWERIQNLKSKIQMVEINPESKIQNLKSQRWRCLSLLPLVIGLVGCSGISTVRSVQENPKRHWFNATVQLKGTVVDRVPLLDAQVYQLQDETGKIWVLTTQPLLETEEQILVRGTVQFESIPIAGQELGEAYIQEKEREVVPANPANNDQKRGDL